MSKDLLRMSKRELIEEILRLQEENRKLATQLKWREEEVNQLLEYRHWFHGYTRAWEEAGIAVEEVEMFS